MPGMCYVCIHRDSDLPRGHFPPIKVYVSVFVLCLFLVYAMFVACIYFMFILCIHYIYIYIQYGV